MESIDTIYFDDQYEVDKVNEEKQNKYSQIQNNFPDMPSMCISIIYELANKWLFKAVKFAKSFENLLNNDIPSSHIISHKGNFGIKG